MERLLTLAFVLFWQGTVLAVPLAGVDFSILMAENLGGFMTGEAGQTSVAISDAAAGIPQTEAKCFFVGRGGVICGRLFFCSGF